MVWEKSEITDNNKKNIANAPFIISASRATDIPAFYSNWLIDKFEKGYCKKRNPYNQKYEYISLDKVQFIVFWTKDPKNILENLKYFDKKEINYYFQFTLNDYEKESYEPNLLNLNQRIEIFQQLSEMIGKEKVIWRNDPLIVSDIIDIDLLIEKVISVGNKIHNYTKKLVFSFVDLNYRKVINNLKTKSFQFYKFTEEQKKYFAEKITLHNKKYWNIDISTCAEISDFEEFNISKNSCIDSKLIQKLSEKNQIINNFIKSFTINNLKDKGQRKECKCFYSKDIGQYNTCPHFCVYCYANFNETTVKNNIKKYNKNNLSITNI